jgi:hypothetical protein
MPTTYEPIATTTLGSSSSSITFSSIPSTYTDLRIIWNISGVSSQSDIPMRFNGNSSTSYSYTYLRGNGSSVASGRLANEAQMFMTGGNSLASGFQVSLIIDIFSYAGSTYKTALAQYLNDRNGSGSVASNVGLWRNTAAINSVTLFAISATLNAGTNATLYGILKA